MLCASAFIEFLLATLLPWRPYAVERACCVLGVLIFNDHGQSWATLILGDLGQSLLILGDLGLSLAILGDLGRSWAILADLW